MNFLHHWLCQSAGWQERVRATLLPWALQGVDLGSKALEIGPGFGVTTDLLSGRVKQLTCVEIDSQLVRRLERRLSSPNVKILCGDAASMPVDGDSFDSVVCFTMLHHVPSVQLQNQVLAEAHRVLRPGGIFAGSDSVGSWRMRLLHIGDTMVLIDPATFAHRLRAVGFIDVHVDSDESAIRFRARKPQELST